MDVPFYDTTQSSGVVHRYKIGRTLLITLEEELSESVTVNQ